MNSTEAEALKCINEKIREARREEKRREKEEADARRIERYKRRDALLSEQKEKQLERATRVDELTKYHEQFGIDVNPNTGKPEMTFFNDVQLFKNNSAGRGMKLFEEIETEYKGELGKLKEINFGDEKQISNYKYNQKINRW